MTSDKKAKRHKKGIFSYDFCALLWLKNSPLPCAHATVRRNPSMRGSDHFLKQSSSEILRSARRRLVTHRLERSRRRSRQTGAREFEALARYVRSSSQQRRRTGGSRPPLVQ